MLPDFPKIKRKWSNLFEQSIKEQIPIGTILSKIRSVRHFEGDEMETGTTDHEIRQSDYQDVEVKFEINKNDVIEKGPKAFWDHLSNLVEDFRYQQSQMLLSRVSDAATRTGNIVDAQNEQFSFEHFLAVYEKTELEFDRKGRPNLLTVVMPDRHKETIIAKFTEWQNDKECMRKFNELIGRKKRDWLDRESNRKLVD